jgi:hypothetical protein
MVHPAMLPLCNPARIAFGLNSHSRQSDHEDGSMTAAATKPIRILLQTTIPYDEDDWNINRFSLLRAALAGLTSADGLPVAEVTARDREPDAGGNDPVLAGIDTSDYDQLWLIGVDTGGDTGISQAECAAITRFRERGGAIFSTRDHQDLGASLCNLGGVGKAHFFHSQQPDPDPDRNRRDDPDNPAIDYPNYHSGSNGDVQPISALDPIHPVLERNGTRVGSLPAHPHEGGVGTPPDDPTARVVVTGTSKATNRPFNIAVAFEPASGNGPGWAESTFHHFCDYNWDVDAGCPSFVSEPPSDAIRKNPSLLDDTKAYVANLVAWLGRRPR